MAYGRQRKGIFADATHLLRYVNPGQYGGVQQVVGNLCQRGRQMHLLQAYTLLEGSVADCGDRVGHIHAR